MQKKRVYIKHFGIICTSFFLLFFCPASYIIGNTAETIINYIVLASAVAWTGFAVFLMRYGYKLNRFMVLIIALYFWCLLLSSFINSLKGNPIDYSGAVVAFSHMLSFSLICDIGLWYSAKKVMKAFLLVGIIACTINALTLFLYYKQGGMFHELTLRNRISSDFYFLGEDNASYFWTWPVLVVSWIYYYLFDGRKRFFIVVSCFTLLVSVAYLYTWSALAFAACLSVPFCLLFFGRQAKRERKNQTGIKQKKMKSRFSLMWITALLFDTLLPMGTLLRYLMPIITGVFRKSATLSYRTLIWERAGYYILQAPIIGYGYEPATISLGKIIVNHTHNLVLETLYRGGLIGIVLLIVSLCALSSKTRTANRSTLYRFLTIMVFFFLIYSSMYFAYYRYHYLFLLMIMTHIELFNKTT